MIRTTAASAESSPVEAGCLMDSRSKPPVKRDYLQLVTSGGMLPVTLPLVPTLVRSLGIGAAKFAAAIYNSMREAGLKEIEGADQRPPPIPAEAPARWVDRDRASGETAPQFLERVYRPWIGQGLSRAHILKLDKALYVALSSWLARKGNELWYPLPTKSEENDFLIKKLENSPAAIPAKDIERLIAAKHRRKVKTKYEL